VKLWGWVSAGRQRSFLDVEGRRCEDPGVDAETFSASDAPACGHAEKFRQDCDPPWYPADGAARILPLGQDSSSY
jgi:hypothetical protein